MNGLDTGQQRGWPRWLKAVFVAILLCLLLAPAAAWLQNRARVVAFSHLRRDGRYQALLDTWTIAPTAVLASFPQTESLICVRPRGPRALQEFLGVDIESARLVGPRVNDTDLAALRRFHELELLELVDTNVTDAAVAHFQQAMPRCRIVRIARLDETASTE